MALYTIYHYLLLLAKHSMQVCDAAWKNIPLVPLDSCVCVFDFFGFGLI